MALPPAETLREMLDYDPETGVLTWKRRPCERWNKRWAGKRAFASDSHGYRAGSLLNKRGVFAHRVIWKMVTGEEPNQVDHINGNRADNRLANLRDADPLTQRRNSARPRHNTSGAVGVCWVQDKARWKAFINLDNSPRHIGYFTDFDEAVSARKAAERRLGFHENHGRAL